MAGQSFHFTLISRIQPEKASHNSKPGGEEKEDSEISWISCIYRVHVPNVPKCHKCKSSFLVAKCVKFLCS